MKMVPQFQEMNIGRESIPVNRSPQARFVQASSVFSVALVVAGLCGIARTFIVAKWLGPHAFGVWRFVNIFAEWLHFASLGTQPALHRWIPFLRGTGDTQKLDSIIQTASTVNFYCAILYSAAVFLWSWRLSEPFSANALAAFAPVILLLVWLNYTLGFSMDIGLHGLRSRLEIIHAISTLVFSLVLIGFVGLYGAILGLGISALLTIAISYKSLGSYYSFFKIDPATLKLLIITGLPIMGDIVLPITMNNVDRIMIAAMLNPEMLGIYSIGSAGVTILGMIPSAVGQMLFVKFAEMHGQRRTEEHMTDVIEKTTLVLSSLFAPILSLAVVVFPLAVIVVLPEYVNGIAAGRLLIAGVFFFAVSLPTTKWCVSTGHYGPVLALRSGFVILEFALVYFIIRGGGSLQLIAFGIFVASAAFSTAIGVICYKILGKPFLGGLIKTCKSMLPFLIVVAVMMAQDFVYGGAGYEFGSRLVTSTALGLIIAVVLSSPFVYQVNRRFQLRDLFVKTA